MQIKLSISTLFTSKAARTLRSLPAVRDTTSSSAQRQVLFLFLSAPRPFKDGEDAKWEDTVPKKKLTKLDDKERKRQQVIHELLQTEQSYLRDLIVMKNLFR